MMIIVDNDEDHSFNSRKMIIIVAFAGFVPIGENIVCSVLFFLDAPHMAYNIASNDVLVDSGRIRNFEYALFS